MFRTVIVTIDGSEPALGAACEAALLAGTDARILAVTVSDSTRADDAPAEASRQPSDVVAAAALAAAAATVGARPRPGPRSRRRSFTGSPRLRSSRRSSASRPI